MLIALAASFACAMTPPAYTHDGDTLRCHDGTRIRIAGVDANEMNGTCHNRCATMSADMARDYLSSLVTGRTLSCVAVGRSYKRIVARCSVGGVDLSCALIAHGAAVKWDRWWRKYHMGVCR